MARVERLPRCSCKDCNEIGTVKTTLNKRGGGVSYLCEFHSRLIAGYTSENRKRVGSDKVSKNTFGCEFETSYSTMKARNEFYANDYLPTDDCTVDVEYKSPIMTGLNKFSKQCATFDALIASGDLEVGAECGTHFHFGDKSFINADTIGYIRRFYQSLFVPLCDVMQEHKAETTLLFGRYFVNYASKINHNTRALKHENFINVQHDNTLEFRICKYRNAAQMMRAARLIKAMGNCIINNFILHFNDEVKHTPENRFDPFDGPTDEEVRAYRKHKADITAQKLVKLYLKAIAEIEVDYTIAAEWEQTGEPHYNW